MDDSSAGDKEYDPMKEIKAAQLQEELVADAFENSYQLLIEAISFDEMIEEKNKNDLDAVLAFDPELGPALIELENMIDFYIKEEEYERCANIRNIMHKRYPESINIEI